jgi:hypothetical protein
MLSIPDLNKSTFSKSDALALVKLHNFLLHLFTVKKSGLQMWSLPISSFPGNSNSQLQSPYFRLCKQRLLAMLSAITLFSVLSLFITIGLKECYPQ